MVAPPPWSNRPGRSDAAVVIIGGGISGICIAIDLLRREKIQSVIILEKGNGFGGTWRDNRYPGAACDVWGHLYCFSFAPCVDNTRMYPGQEGILVSHSQLDTNHTADPLQNYLVTVASKYGLYQHARFNSEVEEARWNDHTLKWEIKVSVRGNESEFGSSYTITSDFLVSAIGQLSRPRMPNFPDMDRFHGKIMHTARWDWSYDFTGKRVAVIGNGATSAQVVPELAKIADQLTVIQRSPGWVVPRHDEAVPEWLRFANKWIPPIRWRYRAEAMDIRERFHSAVTDPNGEPASMYRQANQTMMKAQLPDRPDLWEKLTPQYSPGCKRSVVSDEFYAVFSHSHVDLETRPIEKFTEDGIQFRDDKAQGREFDAVIMATGFEATVSWKITDLQKRLI